MVIGVPHADRVATCKAICDSGIIPGCVGVTILCDDCWVWYTSLTASCAFFDAAGATAYDITGFWQVSYRVENWDSYPSSAGAQVPLWRCRDHVCEQMPIKLWPTPGSQSFSAALGPYLPGLGAWSDVVFHARKNSDPRGAGDFRDGDKVCAAACVDPLPPFVQALVPGGALLVRHV